MKQGMMLGLVLLLLGCQGKKLINDQSTTTLISLGERGKELDRLITPYVQELRTKTNNTAGLAIGITQADKIIYARTFGYAELETKRKVDLNTAFHIASVSKPFSAIAIAKLVQDGKVRLDDLIVDIIPEFKMQGEGYNKITIEHILTHTSGIPRNIAPDDWLNPSYGPKALEESLVIVNNKSLDFEPGTKYSYSNSGFDILGIVIQKISGLSFAEYLQKEVFKPLDMKQASFKMPTDLSAANWASSYSYGITTQAWSPYPYNERLFPSSGVVASITDMCKWGQFHLGKGTWKGKQILKKEVFEQIVSPKYDTPWGDKIGWSWFLQSYLERPIIMHTGFDTGFEAMMYIYPKENISIVVLANRDFSRTGRIVNAVSEMLFEGKAKDYELSAKYPFAKAYQSAGIEEAIATWTRLKKDSLDNYFTDEDDILTTGAILENGGHWKEAGEILTYYLSLNDQSTYAWRLLGNTKLHLGDTLSAKSSYQQALKVNPNYEKAKIALEKLEDQSIPQSKQAIKKQGIEELKSIKLNPSSVKQFEVDASAKIIIYELNGYGSRSGAESVFKQRTGVYKELTQEEVKAFLELINDKSNYGVSSAACHEPRLGIVFYNETNPTAYMSLCLACNNLYTKPILDLGFEGASNNGFTKEARRKIRKLLEQWGFPDDSITIFDDEASVRDVLKKRGWSKEKIDREVKEMGIEN